MLRQIFLGSMALLFSLTSHALTDCHVTLVRVFTGDISGAGQYGLWVDYTYILTTGGTVSNSGYVLLSNMAAANISAAAISAWGSGQTNISMRYLNSAGAAIDSVCGPPVRTDLIGIWLDG